MITLFFVNDFGSILLFRIGGAVAHVDSTEGSPAQHLFHFDDVVLHLLARLHSESYLVYKAECNKE